MSKESALSDQEPLQQKKYESFDQFYEDIPIEGSLGLLAYGASGILAWKKKRQEAGWVPPRPVPGKPVKRKRRKDGGNPDV